MPLTAIVPKLPMRNKAITHAFYVNHLGFSSLSNADFEGYLMLQRDGLEIHFFEHKTLNPLENDGQIYLRTKDIEGLYAEFIKSQTPIHPNGSLEVKPWQQKEFAVLDPDHNLLTFGESL